jgi:hypothetical protein
MTAITTLPTPPSPADTPADFSSKGDALLSALPQFVAEANAMEVALTAAASGINTSTCATSMTVGTGAKSFTAQTARNFLAGQPILIVSTANAANWMFGICTAYTTGTGAMDVTVTQTNGSGTVASWTVSLSGPTTGGTNVQTFAASGTWTKPASGSLAMVELVGPGGNGGLNGGGGGGGAYTVGLYPIAALGATESVTIPTTGGSNSTFGTKQTAYSGGNGATNGGGGGGGSFTAQGGAGVGSAGAGGTGASGLAGTTLAITGGTAGAGAAHGGVGGSNDSRWGGAAGGGGASGAFNGGLGGNADSGGASGGGGGGSSMAGGNGGVSLFGGQGGGGCTVNGAGTMGNGGAVQRNPLIGAGGNASNAAGGTGGVGSGGGGGGTSGPGGPGYCRVTVW